MMARTKGVWSGACLLLILSLAAVRVAHSAVDWDNCTSALYTELPPYINDMGNPKVCAIVARVLACTIRAYGHISKDDLDLIEATVHTEIASDDVLKDIKCQFNFRVLAGLEEGEPFTVPGEASYHETLPTSTPGPKGPGPSPTPPKTTQQCLVEMTHSLPAVHPQSDLSDPTWACPSVESYLLCLEEVLGRRMDEAEIDSALKKIMMDHKISCDWPDPHGNTELQESGSGEEESEIPAKILDGRSQSMLEQLRVGLERNPVYQQCQLTARKDTQGFRNRGEMASPDVCPVVVTFIKCVVGASGITPSQQRLPLIERMVMEVVRSTEWLRGLRCGFDFEAILGFSYGSEYTELGRDPLVWTLQHSTQPLPSEGDQKNLQHSPVPDTTQHPPSEGDPCISQWEAGVRELPAGGDKCPLVTSFLRCRQTSPPEPTAETSRGDQDNIEQQVARIAPSCQNTKGKANPQASKDSNSGPSSFGSGWPTQGILATVVAILVWKLLG